MWYIIPHTKTKIIWHVHAAHGHTRGLFFWHVSIRNSLRSNKKKNDPSIISPQEACFDFARESFIFATRAKSEARNRIRIIISLILSLTRVTKSYLSALGTTQISSYFTKHWTKFLTHQTGNYPVTCFVSKPSRITFVELSIIISLNHLHRNPQQQ